MNDSSQYGKVPGLWWRENGMPVSGTPGQVIPQEKLPTEMPGMAWDLLPMKNYRSHNWHSFAHIKDRQPYASLYTSLGCPYKCTFCCINAPFGGSSFRYWAPEFMISEFEKLAKNYNVKNIKIADEMFVLNKNHFLKLCQMLGERDFGFNIWAYARVDTVKPEYLAALKKAGVNWLALGIESGSKFVRDGVSKGRFGDTDIRDVVRKIQDAGIYVIGNYIFGLPDDDYKSMNETLDMAMDLNCEMGNFYSAMAYPGSKLYTMALEKNWDLPKTWLGFSQHAVESLPLRTEHISAGEVLGFRDYAFHKYFENPTYLNMVKQKFGQATHDHIAQMSKYKLKREFAVAYNPADHVFGKVVNT
jgi:anaerobic magnesium-protoporphyrin IX monomethyl ester cyclase